MVFNRNQNHLLWKGTLNSPPPKKKQHIKHQTLRSIKASCGVVLTSAAPFPRQILQKPFSPLVSLGSSKLGSNGRFKAEDSIHSSLPASTIDTEPRGVKIARAPEVPDVRWRSDRVPCDLCRDSRSNRSLCTTLVYLPLSGRAVRRI